MRGELEKPLFDSSLGLNRDQWESTLAGDYFCRACPGDRGKSGFRYFWESELSEAYDVALAEVQREQAKGVYEASQAIPESNLLRILARDAALAAFLRTEPIYGLTLDQRGSLLDHARGLVALTIEVAS